jgi:hypothetical protein
VDPVGLHPLLRELKKKVYTHPDVPITFSGLGQICCAFVENGTDKKRTDSISVKIAAEYH